MSLTQLPQRFITGSVLIALALVFAGSLTSRAAEPGPNDSVTTEINTIITFEALANDANVDHFGMVNQPAHGQTWSVGNGTISYYPAANYVGSDAFTYTAFSADNLEYTATVSVTVTGSASAVASRDDVLVIDEDGPVAIALTANDASGPGGGPLTTTITTHPQHGKVELQPNGTYLYTPELDWSGEDAIQYAVSDGISASNAQIAITVRPIAEAPRPADDAILINQGAKAEIDILANDIDPEGDLFEVTSISQPALGTATWNNATRMLEYQANPDAVGADSSTYTIADDTGEATATVVITINGRPMAAPDSISLARGTTIEIDALANDSDPEAEILRITRVKGGSKGAVNLDLETGKLTYSASKNAPDSDSFTYFVMDIAGNESSADVTVTVTDSTNGAPVARDDEYLIATDSTGNLLDILSNDSDPDAKPLRVLIDTTPENGEVTVDSTQSVTYVPRPGYVGRDTFAYTITDDGGLTSTAVVTIEVQALNASPVAGPDAITIDEDGSATIRLLDNDADPDGDALSITMISGATMGSLTLDGGVARYLANPNSFGTDVISYVVSDGLGGSSETTLTVEITSINDVPVATDDEVAIEKDAGVVVPVKDNDIDNDGDFLALAIVEQPVLGTATALQSGSITYQPTPGFHGDAVIIYSVTDWANASATATLVIHVGEPNHKPEAKTDRSAVKPNESLTIDAAANDSDPDGDAFAIIWVGEPTHGQATIVGGKIVYVPDPDFTGSDSFKYTIVDAGGKEDTATIKIKVSPDLTPTPDSTP